jgi:uncharacterized membrane protein YkoI
MHNNKKGQIMKTLLFTILFSVIVSASTQQKVSGMTPLRTYNHKPTVKLQKKWQLQSLAKIKENEAQEIAASLCAQNVTSSKLKHRGQLLYYRIYTENCKIEINALDGAIVSKAIL